MPIMWVEVMKSAYLVIIFSFLIIFTASFVLEIKPAEARDAHAPCKFSGPNKDRWIKISHDYSTGKPKCEKTIDWYGVDFSVPEKCGKIPGLYLTDKDCQPPKTVIPDPPRDTPRDTSPPPAKQIPTILTLNEITDPKWIQGSLKTTDGKSVSNKALQLIMIYDMEGKLGSTIHDKKRVMTGSNGVFVYQVKQTNYIEVQAIYPGSSQFGPSSTSIIIQKTMFGEWMDSIALVLLAIIIIIISTVIIKRKLKNRVKGNIRYKSRRKTSPKPTPPKPTPPKPKTSPGESMVFHFACPNCNTKLQPPTSPNAGQKCQSCGWDSYQI